MPHAARKTNCFGMQEGCVSEGVRVMNGAFDKILYRKVIVGARHVRLYGVY